MIELRDISKSYKTGSFVQKALDDVSIAFRDNEFVAVLGPSGSGKTTMLNIIGGLDHADDGDIVINGISTHEYRSGDWDTYRNHRIGFIFQSYNLIPHQSILSNVELALTLAGVPRSQRRERAREALERVGLGEHVDKKPNQLSGGQMQRVAIARALVNDPDIVLADEPTGALDSETGTQVMGLLREVAADRLVIMVTHNAELAQTYATRTVYLSDGQITGDSDPFEPEEAEKTETLDSTATDKTAELGAVPAAAESAESAEPSSGESVSKGRKRRASMSFLTALSLSFNNLMTKKGRTFMTAFAGSIGIIGIAAILALSNGVNNYIAKVEEETLSSYPLTITKTSYDLSGFLTGDGSSGSTSTDSSSESSVDATASDGAGSGDSTVIPEATILSDMFAKIANNDLSSFRTFLESGQSNVYDYVNTISYDYGIEPQVYKNDTSDGAVRLNPSVVSDTMTQSQASTAYMSANIFEQMIDDQTLLDSQYDVVAGRWPQSYDECILVLMPDGSISDYMLYNMGVLDPTELEDLMNKTMSSEEVDVPDTKVDFTYDDALNTTFKVINSCDLYRYNDSQGTWTDMTSDRDYMTQQVDDGLTLRVVGVVQAKSTTTSPALNPGIAYRPDLIDHLATQAADSNVVKQQIANPDVDVFTGKTFEELQSDQNNALDMSSFFSIDTDAISNAFSFDTSALDTSGMDIDTSSLAGDMDMKSIMSGMPMPDFSNIDGSLTADQQSSIAALQAQIIQGFLPYWYAQHPGESINETTDLTADLQAYMQTSAVQAAMGQMAAIMGQATSAQIQAAMQDYMTNTFTPYMQGVMEQMVSSMASAMASSMQQSISAMSGNMSNAISVDENAFANAIHFNMTQADLTSLITNYMNADELTYDNNLTKLGYAEVDKPSSISIYPKSFEDKEQVLSIIDDYNQQMEDQDADDKVISYTDIMGELISSVTNIVNIISEVLIAFVSISLVVSSIMIGIITYISVLERKKEIGILRAMGASKLNIASIFNAETIIEGLFAGVLAIVVVLIASVPVNAYILKIHNVANIMALTWQNALILIGICVLLTLIAGLIPAVSASHRDPVEALRSE